MVKAKDLLGILKENYPQSLISGPGEYGQYEVQIGNVLVEIAPEEWVAMIINSEIRGNPDFDADRLKTDIEELKIAHEFPENYIVAKAIVSAELPDDYSCDGPFFTYSVEDDSGKSSYCSRLIERRKGEFCTGRLLAYIDKMLCIPVTDEFYRTLPKG